MSMDGGYSLEYVQLTMEDNDTSSSSNHRSHVSTVSSKMEKELNTWGIWPV